MPRHNFVRENVSTEDARQTPRLHPPKQTDTTRARQNLKLTTDSSHLSNDAAGREGRAAFLAQMQRSHGNSYVNEFIGNEIVAARGHNSPPTSGPGSHGEPIIRRGRTLNVSSMAADAYHASPVNPHNPVLVWTDGTRLFFAPSQEQLTAGRTLGIPEPSFVPPIGFAAEQVIWVR